MLTAAAITILQGTQLSIWRISWPRLQQESRQAILRQVKPRKPKRLRHRIARAAAEVEAGAGADAAKGSGRRNARGVEEDGGIGDVVVEVDADTRHPRSARPPAATASARDPRAALAAEVPARAFPRVPQPSRRPKVPWHLPARRWRS